MAPMDEEVILPSVIAVHVVPPSVDFHAPPPTAPNQYSFGRASLPATAIDRPPRAGPMLRHVRPLKSSGSMAPSCWALTPGASNKRRRLMVKRALMRGDSTSALTSG